MGLISSDLEVYISSFDKMIGMHCSTRNNLQPKNLLDISVCNEITSPLEGKFKKEVSFLSNGQFSMLSPPSTSTSTLSSSLGGSGGENQGAGSVNEWVDELQPFVGGVDFGHLGEGKFNMGLDEWEGFLSESGGNDQTLFRWVAGGNIDNGFEANVGFEEIHQSPEIQVIPSNNFLSSSTSLGLHQQMQIQLENLEHKPQNFMVNSQLPNPFLRGSQPDHPPAKRHNPGILKQCLVSQMGKVPVVDPHLEQLLRKQNELPPINQSLYGLGQYLNSLPGYLPENEDQEQQQVLYGQLYKAMELILTRNFTQAQGILARLNHQLSPSLKPFQRSSLYFKEALQHVLVMPNVATSLTLRVPNPFDGMLKMSAYKAFSEASPLIQFINFTSNQALLEALDDADSIHIIDFDIGFGAQWSSFIQELPRRKRGPPSLLKLTAFSSPSTHHTIEISLMHGSLTQFANDVGINFELEVVNFDSFDPKFYSLPSSENESVAVNLPIWSIENHLPLLPSLLCFIKQLSPKIVVTTERGCERFELPFPHHLLHSLQYYEVLMDSLDAAKIDPDSANKIERFLFQPKIESIVLGRLRSPDSMPSWKNLFASACFSPTGFSNFAEAQAECVTKRTHIRGFNVEKRQASLVLCYHHHELLTASAWRC